MNNKKKPTGAWRIAIICSCILSLAVMTQTLWAAPKQVAKAKAGDCATCHGKDKILPDSHPDTKSMDWKVCKACHKEGNMDLAGKLPGSHIHQLSGINCASCHGKTKKQEALKMDKCVSCHGSTEKLAEKTEKVKPSNPHTSPHYGTTLDCNLCHRQHAKSENFCAQCHSFKFRVP